MGYILGIATNWGGREVGGGAPTYSGQLLTGGKGGGWWCPYILGTATNWGGREVGVAPTYSGQLLTGGKGGGWWCPYILGTATNWGGREVGGGAPTYLALQLSSLGCSSVVMAVHVAIFTLV